MFVPFENLVFLSVVDAVFLPFLLGQKRKSFYSGKIAEFRFDEYELVDYAAVAAEVGMMITRGSCWLMVTEPPQLDVPYYVKVDVGTSMLLLP